MSNPCRRCWARVGRGEAVALDDVTWQLPGGSSRTLSISLSPLRDHAGQVTGFASIARDVTANRQLEAALRASEENFRALFDQAGDGIFCVDVQGRYLEVNDRYCRLLGRSRAEIVGTHLNDMTVGITPEFFAAVGAQIAHDGSATFERRLRHKDGTLPEVEVTVAPLSGGRRMAIVRDITPRASGLRNSCTTANRNIGCWPTTAPTSSWRRIVRA